MDGGSSEMAENMIYTLMAKTVNQYHGKSKLKKLLLRILLNGEV